MEARKNITDIAQSFIQKTKDQFIVNPNKIEFESDQDKTALLVAVEKIHDPNDYFCGFSKREERIGYFKDPSSCTSCVRAQRIMRAIFGSAYRNMPFVKFLGDRQYKVDFKIAEYFIDHSYEETMTMIEHLANEKQREKALSQEKEEQEKRKKKTQRLIKGFGQKVTKVEGFLEFLLDQEDAIEDIAIKQDVAAYVLDHHWWGSGGGIGMAAVVGAYRNRETVSKSFTYRDQYNAQLDNWSLSYKKVKILKVTAKTITLEASSKKRSVVCEISIPKAKKTTQKKAASPSKASQSRFRTQALKAMEDCERMHQHNHPLFKPTRIEEYKIDTVSLVASWILFEQIDTDRLSQESEGWLGDQFRYSVWVMEKDLKATQLYEDHDYWRPRTVSALTDSRGRDCSLRQLKLGWDKITVLKGEDGSTLTFDLTTQ